MPSACAYLGLYGLIILLGFWQYARDHKKTVVLVGYEPALESAKLLKEWCTWLATLSTASIGASAFAPSGVPWPASDRTLVALAVAAFASAIACTATLLLSLPSMVSRLDKDNVSASNDVYELTAFKWVPKPFAPLLRIGYLAFAQYYFFLFGMACFAVGVTRYAPAAK